MTRQALADDAGCSLSLIGKILAEPMPLSLDLAEAIAGALHVTLPELFVVGSSTSDGTDRAD